MSKRKQEPADDGRTVAPMNLEGMPWYREDPPAKRRAGAGQPPDVPEPMTKRQAARYTWYAVLAGLCIVGVFGLAAALFIRFCTDIWFK